MSRTARSKPKKSQVNKRDPLVNRLLGRILISGSVLLVILLALGTAVSVGRINTWRFNYTPLSADSKPQWNGRDNFLIMLARLDDSQPGLAYVQSLQVLAVFPSTSAVVLLNVPTELSVNISEDNVVDATVKTTYTIKQLYNYYQGQKDLNLLKDPELAFRDQVEIELGISFDRFVMVNNTDWYNWRQDTGLPQFRADSTASSNASIPDLDIEQRQQVQYLKQLLLNANDLTKVAAVGLYNWLNPNVIETKVSTDLAGEELWRLFLFVRNLPDYKISTKIIPLSQSSYIGNFRYLNKDEFDQEVRKLFKNQDLQLEQARIDVINGTGRNGLATRTRRLLLNQGLNVVRLDNAAEPVAQTQLYVLEGQKYLKTIEKLQQIYPDLKVITEEYPLRSTGDLILVVI